MCVIITVAMVMLLRGFRLYGITFMMMRVAILDFTVVLDGKFTSFLYIDLDVVSSNVHLLQEVILTYSTLKLQ
jgi:hypothetical protein